MMQMPPKRLRAFGRLCFAGFLIGALVTAATGLISIWQERGDPYRPPFPEPYPDVMGKVFLSAFLLTVILGLLVSGTRSALGLIEEGRDG